MVAARTLVLSSEWRPINIIPAIRAIAKVFNGRALFVHPDTYRTYEFEDWCLEWDDAIRTAKIAESQVLPMRTRSFVVPEVIVCKHYKGFGYKVKHEYPKFSRRNLWIRDRSVCQFCGTKMNVEDATMDHVLPRSKGGRTSWTNVVLSCMSCNKKKGDRTLAESGMKLTRHPFVPTAKDLQLSPAAKIIASLNNVYPKTWEAFLSKMYWSVELK